MKHFNDHPDGLLKSVHFYLAQAFTNLIASITHPGDDVTRLGNCPDDQIHNHSKPVFFRN